MFSYNTYCNSNRSGYTVLSLQTNIQMKNMQKIWILMVKNTGTTNITLTPLGPIWPAIVDPSAAMRNPGAPFSP